MKIVEALKAIKLNKEKIKDLHIKISQNCANLSHETPVYGTDTSSKVKEWLQSCTDLSQENIRLLCAIQKTNAVTKVSITLSGKDVTKTIAEWVWRRREYANLDKETWSKLWDRGLREGVVQNSIPGASPTEVKIVRHFDPSKRDEMISVYNEEPYKINSTLEIVNAVTDLLE